MATILERTYEFLNNGIGIIPITFRDKRPDFTLLKDGNSSSWEKYKTSLPNTELLDVWFTHGFHNYGVITGWSNLVVLDFDNYTEWIRWRMWASSKETAAHVANHAYQVKTARGVHVYIRINNQERARKIQNIDIKSMGGYVLGAGSVHPSGAVYTALRETLYFPLVNILSDVLPAALLIHDTSITPHNTQYAANIADPWETASHPKVYTDDLVKKIRKTVRIESFFPNAVSTSANSRWLMTVCPFHDDKNPSFWLDTQRQICGCHTKCTDKPLDVINLFSKLYSVNNTEAIWALAKMLG